MKIKVSNVVTISNLTPEQLAYITKGLSLPNPVYQVMLRQNNQRALYAVKKEIPYFKRTPDGLVVGRGILPRLNRHFNHVIDDINTELSIQCINKESPFICNATYRDYQEGTDQCVLPHLQGIIRIDTGWGKSILMMKLIAETQLKTLIVVPRKDLMKQFKSDLKKYCNYECGIINGPVFDVKDVTVATVQTLKKRDLKELRTYFGQVLFDECFDGESLVDTCNGRIKIKDIKIGDRVINATGLGVVTNLISKYSKNIFNLKTDRGEIIATGNHPMFTANGWKTVDKISEQDLILTSSFINDIMSIDINTLIKIYGKKNLCKLPGGVRSKTSLLKKTDVFRSLSLFSNNKKEAAKIISFYKNEIGKESGIFQKERRTSCFSKKNSPRVGYSIIRENEIKKPDAHGRSGRENESKFKKNRPLTESKGWKWSGYASTTKNFISGAWEWLVCRACSFFKREKCYSGEKFANALQDRYSKSKINDCYRSRWRISLFNRKTIARQEKGEGSIFSRVENISIQKPRSYDEFRNGFKVYNLEVSNHPSYSVNGLLVHNCHTYISSQGMRVIESFAPLRLYGLTATADRSDGQGEAIKFCFGDIIVDRKLPFTPPKVKIVKCLEPVWGDTYSTIIDSQVDNINRNKIIAALAIEELKEGRKILILSKRTKHYDFIYDLIPGEYKTYKIKSALKKLERGRQDDLLGRLREGGKDFDIILGTFGLLSTGINIPALDTIIFAGDLKSSVLATQSVGRILRLFEGKKEPKIIDIDDCKSGILHNQARLRKNFYKENEWEIL